MQVVRVSSLTGKVVEASNFFTAKAGQSLLVPIIKMKIKKEEPVAVTQSAVTSSNFSVTKEEQERARAAASLGVKALSIAPVHDNRRLITFDSADPEFDEDSDPDADLDL